MWATLVGIPGLKPLAWESNTETDRITKSLVCPLRLRVREAIEMSYCIDV